MWLPAVLQHCLRPSLPVPNSLCCSDFPIRSCSGATQVGTPHAVSSHAITPTDVPRTSLQPQTTSGYQQCVCVHGGETWGVCRIVGPSAPPWVQTQPLPPGAALLFQYHLSICATPALLVALCPRALVTATVPVQITSSLIPPDTGCSHNKTHLVKERLRVAGRADGTPNCCTRAAQSSDGEDKCHAPIDCPGTEELTLPARQHPLNSTDGSKAPPLPECWQTNESDVATSVFLCAAQRLRTQKRCNGCSGTREHHVPVSCFAHGGAEICCLQLRSDMGRVCGSLQGRAVADSSLLLLLLSIVPQNHCSGRKWDGQGGGVGLYPPGLWISLLASKQLFSISKNELPFGFLCSYLP